jgi:hypothetical protein
MKEWRAARKFLVVPDSNLYSGTELGIQRSIFNYVELNQSYFQRYSSFDVMRSRQIGNHLQVFSNSRTERIIWEFPGQDQEPIARALEVTDKLTGRKIVYVAEIEIIFSSGTFDDVTLLQRSGVGNCTELAALNISCVIHNPKVGAEFLYHMVFATLMTVNQPDQVIGPNSQFNTQVGVGISTQNQAYPDATIDFHMETNPNFLPSPPLPTPVAFGILLSLRDFGPGKITLNPIDHHKPQIDLKLFQNAWEVPHLMALFKEYRSLLNTSSVYQFEISPG